jgi:hypothetical protein
MNPLRGVPSRPVTVKQNKRRLAVVLARLTALRSEGLALYRALPVGEAAHASTAKFKVCEGSNRSTKTTWGVAELARALCACDPYDKYVKRNGVAMVVGLKQDNIAMLWRKLAYPGAFKIVRDEHTKLLRAVRPDPNDPLHIDPYDLSYQEKWQDAPPLLPPRLCDPKTDVAWDDAGKGVPRTVRVPSTGWRMEMRPSGSRPDQGDHFNVVLNDEEMDRPDWYYEEVRGLTGLSEIPKHTPRLIWTATSQVANPEFAEMREKALADVPGFARFVFLIKDNPYVPDEEKAAFYAALPEYERETRYHGIPAVAQRRIYGTYDPMGIHGCEPFEVPTNWTRYAIVDPSTAVCATLLIAIDPDEKHAWIYGGFVLNKAEAVEWAYKLKDVEGGVRFEAVYMDERAGNQKSFNAAETTAQRFAEAIEQAEVSPRSSGPMAGFFPGTADVKTRTIALRGWLAPRAGNSPFSGLPFMQIMRGVLPELDKQIKDANSDRKDPEKRAKIEQHPCDLLDDLEYAAAARLHYHEPEKLVENKLSPAVEDFRRLEKKRRNTFQPCMSLG